MNDDAALAQRAGISTYDESFAGRVAEVILFLVYV